MSSADSVLGSSQRQTVRRRYRSRVSNAVWPFVWRGLLPLLGLLALTWYALLPFARGSIESVARSEIRNALDAGGFGWVNIGISGQHVQLRGTEPAAGAGDAAVELARRATCPTWWGRRTCAVQVTGSFEQSAKLLPVLPEPAVVDAPADVPSQSAVASCENELASLLAETQLRFASSKAEIRAESMPLLDELATAVKRCPGTLRVEGHTDSLGDAAFNQSLSELRAAAVREALVARGVPGDRLVPQGFGSTRPVADNAAAPGRALNRRIEFKVIDAP